ncbi:hypothetical protein ACFV2H_48885 [Streptomyces sp. NPDC059629]
MPELVSPPRAIVESGSVDVVVQDSHYNLWGPPATTSPSRGHS